MLSTTTCPSFPSMMILQQFRKSSEALFSNTCPDGSSKLDQCSPAHLIHAEPCGFHSPTYRSGMPQGQGLANVGPIPCHATVDRPALLAIARGLPTRIGYTLCYNRPSPPQKKTSLRQQLLKHAFKKKLAHPRLVGHSMKAPSALCAKVTTLFRGFPAPGA